MHNSVIARPIEVSHRFRTPSALEKRFGLWVDRIGKETDARVVPHYRRLGLFAAVHILEGAGLFDSPATGELAAGAGDTMLLFPDEPARYHPRGRWTTCWVVWEGPEARTLAELGLFRPARPLVRDAAGAVPAAHAALAPLMQEESPGACLARKSLLLNMLMQLSEQQAAADAGAREPRLDALVASIHRHPEARRRLPELAAACGLSESQFRRLFHAATGRTPVDFILAARISRAKERLLSGESVKAVARATGFRDEFHFMRTFHRLAGSTVGEFRKAGRG